MFCSFAFSKPNTGSNHVVKWVPKFEDMDAEGDKVEVVPCMAFDYDYYFTTDYYSDDSWWFDEPFSLSGGEYYSVKSPGFPQPYEKNLL